MNLPGRGEEALALLDEKQDILEGVDDKEALLHVLNLRAHILMTLRSRGADVIQVLENVEKLSKELGDKRSLAGCYWRWATAAEDLGQRSVATDKLPLALALFTELKMPKERDAVQGFLNWLTM
jgi:hypothetical protein